MLACTVATHKFILFAGKIQSNWTKNHDGRYKEGSKGRKSTYAIYYTCHSNTLSCLVVGDVWSWNSLCGVSNQPNAIFRWSMLAHSYAI